MAYAKKNTMEAFGSAKSYMSGLFGWDQGKEQDDSQKAAAADQDGEEVKKDEDDDDKDKPE